MPRASGESRALTAGKWLLAFVIVASALALGSLPTEVLIVMSALAALACGLVWLDGDVATSRASQLVLIALALLLGMTILQAVPLPSSLAHTLAPANADIWERALTPLRETGPAWHSLGVAPAATDAEVLRGFFYACVFLAALRVAALEHGERFLLRVVVFSSVAMAVSALAHNAVSAEKVFGIYRPRELYAYQPGRFSPLLNTNHLAAYLNIGACVALGALLTRRTMPRALSASAVLILAATSVWQSSRGAAGTLLFGMALTVALTMYAKRKFHSARVEGLILAGCALAATVIVTVALSDARTHLLSKDLTKLNVARSSLALIGASPWFGVGRGAFETVFSSVREGPNYITFTNPEDLLVQWTVEWGLPVSAVGVALLGWALRPKFVLRAVRPSIGAWVAILAAVMHELVDYHFEVPGVVALAAVCAAVVVGGRASTREVLAAPRPRWSVGARAAALVAVLGTLCAIASVWPDIGHTLAEDRRRLSALAVDKSVSYSAFVDDVRASMLRYPAEPFLPLMGAVRVQANGEGSVVAWVARALERNPRFGRAHYVLARSLAPRHPAQARLEYRLAYENDEGLRDSVVKEAVFVIDSPTAAMELVPDGAAGIDVLDALVAALSTRLPSTAVILDEELERRSPGTTASFRRRAEAAVADAVGNALWCVGNDCVLDALAAADELARREPTQCHSHVLVARVRVKMKEVVPALDGLEKAIELVADRSECRKQFIMLSLDSGQPRRADVALDQLVRAGCAGQADCEQLYTWAASTEESRGHFVRAVRLYRRVLESAPEREDVLQRIGALGDRDGCLSEGLDAYASLAMRHPSDPQWPARIAQLRAKGAPGRPTLPTP